MLTYCRVTGHTSLYHKCSDDFILRPPIQPGTPGLKLKVVLKCRGIYIEIIRVVLLMAGVKTEGIVKWKSLKSQGPLYIHYIYSLRPSRKLLREESPMFSMSWFYWPLWSWFLLYPPTCTCNMCKFLQFKTPPSHFKISLDILRLLIRANTSIFNVNIPLF